MAASGSSFNKTAKIEIRNSVLNNVGSKSRIRLRSELSLQEKLVKQKRQQTEIQRRRAQLVEKCSSPRRSVSLNRTLMAAAASNTANANIGSKPPRGLRRASSSPGSKTKTRRRKRSTRPTRSSSGSNWSVTSDGTTKQTTETHTTMSSTDTQSSDSRAQTEVSSSDQWSVDRIWKEASSCEPVSSEKMPRFSKHSVLQEVRSRHPKNAIIGKPNSKRQFSITRFIARGSCSAVFQGLHLSTNTPVAIKVDFRCRPRNLLRMEAKVLYSMQSQKKESGYPKLFWYGKGAKNTEQEPYRYVVLQLLGPSIEDLFQAHCTEMQKVRKLKDVGKDPPFDGFPKPTLHILMQELLKRLEQLHTSGLVHRDIKPDNFLSSLQDSDGTQPRTIFVVDFGLSTSWIRCREDYVRPINMKTGLPFVGTPRFASVAAHRGVTQGPKDDLESLGFVILHLYMRIVPWKVQKINKQEKQETRVRILNMKEEFLAGLKGGSKETSRRILSDFEALRAYFLYVSNMKYGELPDYKRLLKLFPVDSDDAYVWNIAQ